MINVSRRSERSRSTWASHYCSQNLLRANHSLYMALSEYVVSGELIREEEKVQRPVYYISKQLIDAETKYPEMEKLTLALVIASRKLRPYFHSHTICVLTNYPLRHVL